MSKALKTIIPLNMKRNGERGESLRTCDSYIFSLRFATSLRMMVPMYSITMVYFSMSRAAYSPKPYNKHPLVFNAVKRL